MNWLTCTHCGRSVYVTQPEVLDELGRYGISLLCPGGRTDRWLWTAHPCGKDDLPILREQRAAALRVVAIAAASSPDNAASVSSRQGLADAVSFPQPTGGKVGNSELNINGGQSYALRHGSPCPVSKTAAEQTQSLISESKRSPRET